MVNSGLHIFGVFFILEHYNVRALSSTVSKTVGTVYMGNFREQVEVFNVITAFVYHRQPKRHRGNGRRQFNFVFEFRTGLRLGNVGFYGSTRGHIVLAGRNFPNGINTSSVCK